jgi:peptidoglycan hydrolase-like protein with peptidoglycan-binding domain
MALTAPGNQGPIQAGFSLPAYTGPITTGNPTTTPSATANTPPPPAGNQAALVADQTSRYANAPFNPTGFDSPVALAPDLQVQALLSDLEDVAPLLRAMSSEDPSLLPVIPPEKRARLDRLAQGMGFTGFRMLQYQMRNLPEAKIQAILQAAKTNLLALPRSNNGNPPNQTDLQKALADGFEGTLRSELNGLFSRAGFPAPELKENGGRWDAASLSSVYNALFEIHERSPEKLAVIGRSSGNTPEGHPKPLSFTRTGEPQVGSSNNFLETLNQSMFLAHADQDTGGISLSTSGVRDGARSVVSQIAGSVSLLTRSVEGNVVPTYTQRELRDRGLNSENLTELKGKLLGDYVQRFGGVEKLQEAVNFIIRYRALNRPENVTEGRAPLAEVAINGNPNSADLVATLNRLGPTLLREVGARMEQTHTVTQLQTFMREHSSFGTRTNLASDGYYGNRTQEAVRQFQMTLVLNTLKERLEDDRQIPAGKRLQSLQFFETQFKRLEANPGQFSQILRDVTTHMQTLLTPTRQVSAETAGPLQEDLRLIRGMTSGTTNGVFDSETAQRLVGSWFNVMDSGSNLDMAEQLVSHEVSHLWERQLDKEGNLQVLDNWGRFFDQDQASQAQFGVFHMSNHDAHDRLHDDRTAASDYGSISAKEDFAESSRVFTYDPERLLRRSMLKFLVMNSLHGNPYNSSEIMRMAENSGYSKEQVQAGLDRVLGYGQNPIRFSPALATRLDQDYTSLRQAASLSEHAAATLTEPGRASSDALTEAAAAIEHTPLPPTAASESGWSLDYLQGRYNSVLAQLNRSDLSQEQRQGLRDEMAKFEEDFVSGGLQSLGDNTIPNQAVSALQGHLSTLGYSGDQAIQGRAVILALAKLRAQGHLNPSEEARFKDYLPQGFQGMLNDPEFVRSVTYGNTAGRSVSPSSVLTYALVQSQRLEAEMERAMGQLGSAARRVSEALTSVSSLLSPANSGGGSGASGPARDSSISAQGSQRSAMTRQLVANPQFNLAWQLMNRTFQAYSQATGVSMPLPSREEFARYVLDNMGSGPPDAARLRSILENMIKRTAP